ncbi:hypothetical protein AVEN_42240-1 [Araneus ventricosus]|uniref:Uncharacterized protein n=1 Tax=Araneus ventricosus TaxID=182803 RepID=A0A4Y2AYW6_ARAVE|nr:hypothetical protein AVEN_42240-1 [Araneus ventricosus]
MQNGPPLPPPSCPWSGKIHHWDRAPMGQTTNDEIKMNLLSGTMLCSSQSGEEMDTHHTKDYHGITKGGISCSQGDPFPGLIAFPVFRKISRIQLSSNCIKGLEELLEVLIYFLIPFRFEFRTKKKIFLYLPRISVVQELKNHCH